MADVVQHLTGAGTRRTRRPVRIDVEQVSQRVGQRIPVLNDVSFSVLPGELVAIVGGSGAGKTTLLEAMAGVHAPTTGRVCFDGADLYDNVAAFRSILGYVPQDDIIHTDLPLVRTLWYAARLRLEPTVSRQDATVAVESAIGALDLQGWEDVRVDALSGGQRKRASIAVELLTEPHVFFLDEPTSGLDPATGAELLRVLRRLAESGATVVFTTHAVQDVAVCDRIVFLAPGGHLAFVGTPAEALDHFAVDAVEQIYGRLADDGSPEDAARRFAEHRRLATEGRARPEPAPAIGSRRRQAGHLRQWAVLTERAMETMVRDKLTMLILLGSPAMVVAMFVILFRPGAFRLADPSPSTIVMIVFWVTFGAFFFGLTYGLLQICTERAILRREHLVGLRLNAYLLSKLAVLMPFLIAVNVVMLAVLRALDRLPAASLHTYLSLGVTLALDAGAALALGVLTSAAVGNPSQAALALPMLCFPAVLFSGAILPVHLMAGVGRAISTVMPDRWAFEAIGHDLGVRGLLTRGGSPLGPPLIATFGSAGSHATPTYWAFLAVFVLVFLVTARLALARTCGRR